MYQRLQISDDTEKDIVVGLITDTRFGREILGKTLKLEHFNSKYIRRVVQWVMNYYKTYNVAPFMDMMSIFNAEKDKMKAEEQEFIEVFLTDISHRYARTDRTKPLAHNGYPSRGGRPGIAAGT